MVRPRIHPEEVIPEKGECYRAVQARDTLAFQQQMLDVAPSVFPSRLSPRSRIKIRTRGEDVIVAETTCCGNSSVPRVNSMISDQVRRPQGHNWVHNRCLCSSASRPDRCAPKRYALRGSGHLQPTWRVYGEPVRGAADAYAAPVTAVWHGLQAPAHECRRTDPNPDVFARGVGYLAHHV